MLELKETWIESSEREAVDSDPYGTEIEHPLVTVKKVSARPRPHGQVIVFANQKGGVGKSTLAFHCAIALCDAGARVAVIDLDCGQQSLSNCLENRSRTARFLDTVLPMPRQVVLQKQNGAQLSQEIARIGSDCDFVIIDLAGQDSLVARFAIGLADKLVTPINCSSIDIDLLGRINPLTGQLQERGRFAQLVNALNDARQSLGTNRADWIVVKNRVRSAEKKQQIRIENALSHLSKSAKFRVSDGLSERVVYRELLPFGLTHFDLKWIPMLARMQLKAQDEILQLVSDLNLRPFSPSQRMRRTPRRARVCQDVAQSFAMSVHSHDHPVCE